VSTSLLDANGASIAPVDFRRPSRIGRDAIVALQNTHEAFARRLSTVWSTGSYAAIEVEHVATDQLSIDDFVRTLPTPTALGGVRIPALGALAFVQVDLPFALLYIERLLGGPGDASLAPIGRRPTDLETALLIHELLMPAVAAIDEALRDLRGEPSSLQLFETTPQPLQLGSPGELLLLLTYRVEVRGEVSGQGMATLAYPVAPLVSVLDQLLTGSNTQSVDDHDLANSPIADAVLGAPLDVRVRIGGTPLYASQLAALQPGDVIRLDHPVQRPAMLVVDERPVGTAHLGKRGRRLAAQVVVPPAVPTL
jgi:flagellar motor switch protein FliM